MATTKKRRRKKRKREPILCSEIPGLCLTLAADVRGEREK
jgi:hypothetical protein